MNSYGDHYYLLVPPLSLGAKTILELEPTAETYTTCLPPSHTFRNSFMACTIPSLIGSEFDRPTLPFPYCPLFYGVLPQHLLQPERRGTEWH